MIDLDGIKTFEIPETGIVTDFIRYCPTIARAAKAVGVDISLYETSELPICVLPEEAEPILREVHPRLRLPTPEESLAIRAYAKEKSPELLKSINQLRGNIEGEQVKEGNKYRYLDRSGQLAETILNPDESKHLDEMVHLAYLSLSLAFRGILPKA